MTSSISLNEAPKEVRIEGTPILAIKKSITPRNGPTRMTASATHLLAGSRLGDARGARRRLEMKAASGLKLFNDSVDAAESEGAAVGAIDNFIMTQTLASFE